MRQVALFFGALALVAGMAFATTGFLYPRGYDLSTASAVQITQVYSEANYYILLSIAAFAMSIAFVTASNGERKVDTEAIENLLKLQISMSKKRELEKGVPKSFLETD